MWKSSSSIAPMKSYITLFVLLEVVFVDFVLSSSIKMDFRASAHVRLDPIITQTCISDHVHTFYGANTVDPNVSFEDLRKMKNTNNTGNVLENMSLYWHPSVYAYSQKHNTYTRSDIAYASAYYIWEFGAGARAFPPGFRMIAGVNDTEQKSRPGATECGDNAPVTPCLRPDGDCTTTGSHFFPAKPCHEMEAFMHFPSCWDGVNLDSPDHSSHVAYTNDTLVTGTCPPGFPVKIPQIALFFRIKPYVGGWHVFSTGTDEFHADYISGWDEKQLQFVLDNCNTPSMDSEPDSFCEDFLTFRDAPKGLGGSDEKLQADLMPFQPPPLNTKLYAPEEVDFVSALPRGACSGTLLSGGNGGNPSNSQQPTSPVTPSQPPAPSPVPSPTEFPTESDFEESEDLLGSAEIKGSAYSWDSHQSNSHWAKSDAFDSHQRGNRLDLARCLFFLGLTFFILT